jgi:pSer/pThr/pTyr-binding forkhead associated (FHA) protein
LREERFALLQFDEQDRVLGKVELRKPGQSMIVGRSSHSADLVIPVEEVSRKHAQMIIYEKNILLEDCYSSNGTFVNDEMVGRSRVRAGDIVRFGSKQQFLLCYAAPDVAGAPG